MVKNNYISASLVPSAYNPLQAIAGQNFEIPTAVQVLPYYQWYNKNMDFPTQQEALF